MNQKKYLIIVPAFNEKENIQKTISEISSLGLGIDILVVDDGSQDNTRVYAHKTSAQVVPLPFNLGIGGAVQTGYQYARLKGYDIAVQIDADGQHDPGYLKDVLLPLEQGIADVAIGSRFCGHDPGYRSSFIRRVGINFFANLISFLTGFRITDPTSGFRAVNQKAIAIYAENYPKDFPEPEAIVIARKYSLRVVEVPVKMRERRFGQSSIRYLKTLHYMVKVTFAILLDMMKTRKEINP